MATRTEEEAVVVTDTRMTREDMGTATEETTTVTATTIMDTHTRQTR